MSISDTSAHVLQALGAELGNLSPELRKAAAYVLENPNDVGVSSIREIAEDAGVKPNTFVRMARCVGFKGYDDFREPFREEIRRGAISFPDRARWLQSLAKGGKLAGLYADIVASAIRNIEQTFASTDHQSVKRAADTIVAARRTYVLGVGVNNTNARNFTYLADMALDSLQSIPKQGSTATDDLVRANSDDALVAMTCKPYRTEVVEAVALAKSQGVTIIAISDSPASPIVIDAHHSFIVEADTPQIFPSSVCTIALLEALMAFVIADAKPNVIANIEKFHARRHELGIYAEG
ncbi:MAG: MurR/RpiR family transcriptional regulator [Gammaproteobacteria bacterium]|nr:MurR/RpiR family transcriptional regulator [Gammaproteobacteria bacterium]